MNDTVRKYNISFIVDTCRKLLQDLPQNTCETAQEYGNQMDFGSAQAIHV